MELIEPTFIEKTHDMRISTFLLPLVIAIMLSSCASTERITYFQDVRPGEQITQGITPVTVKVQPEDKISIIVNSKDPLLADLFNLPIVSRQLGTKNSGSGSSSQGISGYTVRQDGTIDFPVLGSVYVAGMTREEIAAHIKSELISQNLIKDPVVTVEFMNLTVSVLGEVANPGRYSIDKDYITLLEALSMAGDMTIFGKRDKVLVLREVEGQQRVYGVDLRSAEQLYNSPVYYLQQDDVVYVEPNSMRARQSTVNGNNVLSATFWMSLVSLITTVTVLFVK